MQLAPRMVINRLRTRKNLIVELHAASDEFRDLGAGALPILLQLLSAVSPRPQPSQPTHATPRYEHARITAARRSRNHSSSTRGSRGQPHATHRVRALRRRRPRLALESSCYGRGHGVAAAEDRARPRREHRRAQRRRRPGGCDALDVRTIVSTRKGVSKQAKSSENAWLRSAAAMASARGRSPNAPHGSSAANFCKGRRQNSPRNAATCVEIKILRRVRPESPRRPPRHRRYIFSMAWRCRFLPARRKQRGDVIAEK